MLPLVVIFAAAAAQPAPPPDVVERIDASPSATTSPAAQAAEGDVVERVDAPAAPASAAATEAAAEGERFEAHGWARQSAEVFLPPDAPEPGRDRLVLRTQLLLRARYARGRSFEATVSGLLAQSIFEGQQPRAARGAFEPQLREAYVGLFWKRLDLRIGQQRVAWGRAEFLSPNDVVNARDSRDPFVGENELRFVPTPLVRADLDVGIGSLQAIVQPVFIPDRYDVYGTNWSGIQPDAPEPLRSLASSFGGRFDPTLFDEGQRALQQTSRPAQDLLHPAAGARFTASVHSFDLGIAYHYGFDGPYVNVDPAFTTLSASYVRRHHVGIDAATIVGPFALRLDAAFQDKHVFARRDLLSWAGPSLQAVASVEYQTGDPEKVLLVEGLYQRVLETPPIPLLVWTMDSVGAAAFVRWPLFGPLHAEMRAIVGIRPITYVLKPQIGAKAGAFFIAVGGLIVDGDAASFGHYYRRNDEAYATVRWSF